MPSCHRVYMTHNKLSSYSGSFGREIGRERKWRRRRKREEERREMNGGEKKNREKGGGWGVQDSNTNDLHLLPHWLKTMATTSPSTDGNIPCRRSKSSILTKSLSQQSQCLRYSLPSQPHSSYHQSSFCC